MRALDVMTTPVISVKPEMTVAEAAKVLVDHRISGVPVIDEKGSLVGMLSEGDLICRGEIGTQKRHRSWWLELFSSARDAKDYIKSHGNRVAEVMTTDVISVDEATSLREVANILEKRRIKRVPVMRAHQVVGLVSRANLVQALASAGAEPAPEVIPTDREIRAMLMEKLRTILGVLPARIFLCVTAWFTCGESTDRLRQCRPCASPRSAFTG